ncbi:hypothetical protein ACUXPM_000853 [Ralstonia sp. 151470066-2]
MLGCALRCKAFVDRHHVRRLPCGDEFTDRAKNLGMVCTVKVLAGQSINAVNGIVVEHQAAEHRLFSLNALGRYKIIARGHAAFRL